MSDTPRTDELAVSLDKAWSECQLWPETHPEGITAICELRNNYPALRDRARQLERELSVLRSDAERYRWLRKANYNQIDDGLPYPAVHKQNSWGKWYDDLLNGNKLDAAIDEALHTATGETDEQQ